MGMVGVVLVLVVVVSFLIKTIIRQFVCPHCGGELRRTFEKMQCRGCGRYIYMWQARRRPAAR
jgi:hypothetical protein